MQDIVLLEAAFLVKVITNTLNCMKNKGIFRRLICYKHLHVIVGLGEKTQAPFLVEINWLGRLKRALTHTMDRSDKM